MINSEAYLEPCQTSKMALFAKIINDSFAKSSILDVGQGSEYTSETTEAYLRLCQTCKM